MPETTSAASPAPLAGLAALVTGGSRGIGAAVARRLAREGADVAVTYRAGKEGAEAVAAEVRAAGRRALALPADAADPAAVRAAVDAAADGFDRLDVLVNNAGAWFDGPFEDVPAEEFDRAVAVHVRGPFAAAQAAVRHMRDDGTGRIVSIGSNLAARPGRPGVALYALTKAALDGMARGLARDLGARRITANTVHPGSTDTAMNPAGGAHADAQRAQIALGAYGEPEDIAAAVAYLAGPGGRHVTGTSITVDGGANT